jgi:hypothetical protein
MGCFTTILFLIGAVFVMVTMIRWFEQATEAVELRWWNKVFVLLAMPFTVWFFPSRCERRTPNDAAATRTRARVRLAPERRDRRSRRADGG